MSILEKEVWITLNSATIGYYENIGYFIERRLDQQGRLGVKRGSKLLVKIEDVPKASNVKVTRICDSCGDRKIQPLVVIIEKRNNHNDKDMCGKCSGHQKTTTTFIKEVYDVVGLEYEVIGEYKTNHTHIDMMHTLCGKVYPVKPSNFLSGRRCPKCFRGVKKTKEEFNLQICDLIGNEYIILDEYINDQTHIKMKHILCGNEFPVTPCNFLKEKGTRCPKCFGKNKKTTEEFRMEVYNIVKNEFIVIGEYKNSQTPIDMKHCICNNIFPMIPNNFLRGNRCPKCKESKGEKRIGDWLLKNDYISKDQYKFVDCKDRKPLPFDRAIIDSNKKVFLLIEYDGEHHFKPTTFGGISDERAEKAFKKQQKRDKIKNEYCAKNNIPLLRIPYTEFNNIEAILEKELNKYGLLQSTL